MEVEAAHTEEAVHTETEKALADLSGALRKAFRASGLTIEAVAEKTQLPVDRVRRCIQAGAYSGSLETLVAVFDAVGINLHIRLEKKSEYRRQLHPLGNRVIFS